MNKEKLKHLPFNAIFSIYSFIVPYMLLSDVAKINEYASFGIAFYIYLLDLKYQTDVDYLEEKIKNIENKLEN